MRTRYSRAGDANRWARDMKDIVLVTIIASLLAGCTAHQPEITHESKAVVTQEFLSEHGFWESEGGRGVFSLLDVRLGDASRDLGFALADLRRTPSQPRFSDVRNVRIRNLHFVVRARIQAIDGKKVVDSLDDPDAMCTISVAIQQVPPEREITKKGQ